MSEDIVKYCDDNGIKIAVGLMMRFNTYHQEMKKLIAEGKLGQIVSCHAQFTCWYPEMANAWRQTKASAGGGAMTDLGIHCLDLIEYITGSRIVRLVRSATT
jgi:predicted dehydrogenase